MVGHSTQHIDCTVFTGSSRLPVKEGNVTLIISNLILIFGLPERFNLKILDLTALVNIVTL